MGAGVRRTTPALALVVLLGVLTACSEKKDADEPTAAPSSEPTKKGGKRRPERAAQR